VADALRLVIGSDGAAHPCEQVLTTGRRVIGLELAGRPVHGWPSYRSDTASAPAAEVAGISRCEARADA